MDLKCKTVVMYKIGRSGGKGGPGGPKIVLYDGPRIVVQKNSCVVGGTTTGWPKDQDVTDVTELCFQRKTKRS